MTYNGIDYLRSVDLADLEARAMRALTERQNVPATVYTLNDLEGVYEMPSPEVSSLFQQLLFSVGITWALDEACVKYTDKHYLYVEGARAWRNQVITWGMRAPSPEYARRTVDHAIKVVEYLNG